MLAEQLFGAWRRRAFAEVWRIGRQIAGTRKGIRRRDYAIPPRFLPSAAETEAFLRRPPSEGGMNARRVEAEEVRRQNAEDAAAAPQSAPAPWLVHEDYDALVKYMKKAAKRI